MAVLSNPLASYAYWPSAGLANLFGQVATFQPSDFGSGLIADGSSPLISWSGARDSVEALRSIVTGGLGDPSSSPHRVVPFFLLNKIPTPQPASPSLLSQLSPVITPPSLENFDFHQYLLSPGGVGSPASGVADPEKYLGMIQQELDRVGRRMNTLEGRLAGDVYDAYEGERIKLIKRATFWGREIARARELPSEPRKRYREDILIGERILLDQILIFGASLFNEPIDETDLGQMKLRSRLRIRGTLPAPRRPSTERKEKEGHPLPALVNRDVGFGRSLKLRPHQEEALAAIRGRIRYLQDQISSGPVDPDQLSATIVMPVGAGKTRTMIAGFAAAISEKRFDAARGDKMLILNHTDQIHGQNMKVLHLIAPYFKKVFGRPLRVSEYKADNKDTSGDIVVVSIPSVNNQERREQFERELRKDLGRSGQVVMAAIDEVHHLSLGRGRTKGTWAELVSLLRSVSPNFLQLGFTATPTGEDLARALCKSKDLELMRAGVTPRTYLVEVEGVDLTKLKVTTSGDFSQGELQSVLLEHPTRNLRLFETLVRQGLRRQTQTPSGKGSLEAVLGFAADLKHAAMMAGDYADYFRQDDYGFTGLGGRTLRILGEDRGKISTDDLTEALADYNHGRIDGIVAIVSGLTKQQKGPILQAVERGEIEAVFTVDVLVEGADLYMFTHQLGARPTFSRTKKGQERGRINRRARDEVSDDGRLLKDPPRMLFDVVDRYNSYERSLARYREVIGILGHRAQEGELFDVVAGTVVEKANREGRTGGREGPPAPPPTPAPTAVEIPEAVRPMVELLRSILEEIYENDLASLARDLGETEDYLLGLLEGRGWRTDQWFLRRLATLLYLTRDLFMEVLSEARELGDERVSAGDHEILRRALAQYEEWEGPIVLDGEETGKDNLKISGNILNDLTRGTLGPVQWRDLWRVLFSYFEERSGRTDIEERSNATTWAERLLEHLFERQGWAREATSARERLLLQARVGVARMFGGNLLARPDGLPSQKSGATLTRWLNGEEIRFGRGNSATEFCPQVRLLLTRHLGVEEGTADRLIEEEVFERQGWTREATSARERLLLQARVGVAGRFGGELPEQLDGLPAQQSRSPLTRWLNGEEIRFGRGKSATEFYHEVRLLLTRHLGVEEGTADRLIEGAVFERQGWAREATSARERLLLQARVGVARRFGGQLPRQLDKLPEQQSGRLLTRWLNGEEVRFGRGKSATKFYHEVRLLLTRHLGVEEGTADRLIEEEKKERD